MTHTKITNIDYFPQLDRKATVRSVFILVQTRLSLVHIAIIYYFCSFCLFTLPSLGHLWDPFSLKNIKHFLFMYVANIFFT